MSGLLAVGLDGTAAEVWRECADVLYCARALPPAVAWELSAVVLRRYPGALLVLVPRTDGGFVARARDVRGRSATARGSLGPPA